MYEDLKTVSEGVKTLRIRQGHENLAVPESSSVVYEVSPSGLEYEVPKTTPEYLELYNTDAPNASRVPDTTPEYLELHNTDAPNASRVQDTTPEYLEPYSTDAQNANREPELLQISEKTAVYESNILPSPNPDLETNPDPGSNPGPVAEVNDLGAKNSSVYTTLDEQTRDKPNMYQSIGREDDPSDPDPALVPDSGSNPDPVSKPDQVNDLGVNNSSEYIALDKQTMDKPNLYQSIGRENDPSNPDPASVPDSGSNPDPDLNKIPNTGTEYLELDSASSEGYMALDKQTMDEPSTYQAIVAESDENSSTI